MKPPKLHVHKIEMVNDFGYVEPKDWMRRIRAEIQHLRQAHSKAMKNNSRVTSGTLDLEPAMEKRRISALMNSLENQTEERHKYADDWITLNIFSESYAPIQYDGHILTAASIWILDRITELNVSLDKLYPILPDNDELLDEMFEVDVWDCQYDEELIASVEYVLHYRNQDIAPLEPIGHESERIITSCLNAEGKDRVDVLSRRNFEALLALIPQSVKDEALKHFEECYSAWIDRFFTAISYLQEQHKEAGAVVNALRAELNELQENVKKKLNQLEKDREKIRKTQRDKVKAMQSKQAVNVLLKNPTQPQTELPLLSNQGITFPTPSSPLFLKEDNRELCNEIDKLVNRVKEIYEQHDEAMEELDEVVNKRAKFLYMIVHSGYLTSDMVRDYFPCEYFEELTKPLPIADPYELCFALLYAVETGSDIPWLYGSCIGMMSEVIDSLPWGLADFEELYDPYWKDEPLRSSKLPDFPDWYKRDYTWKGEDEYDARSLAQIVYEKTGCIMPRNLHRYDAELKELSKYGIKQNKAIAILYCMLALGNSRHQKHAVNLEYDCKMDTVETNSSKKHTLQDISELEKQIQQLRSALHNAEKSAEDARKKLAEQKAATEAEHRELADLREVIFNKEELENYDSSLTENMDADKYPYTVKKSTVVFGGHETWVKSLKPMLKGDIKFIAKEMKIDTSLVRYADAIWIQTNAIPHRSYYSIVNTARKLGKPIRYFTNASAVKCAEQIVDNDKND